MPGSVNGAAAAERIAEPQSISQAIDSFCKAVSDLAKSVIRAVRSSPPQPATQQAPNQQAQNAQRAAGANAAVAANAPPANVPFNAEKWMIEQCKLLENAISNQNANANGGLDGLYKVAQSFKQQITELGDDIQGAWPAELRADYNANLRLIEGHFNGAENSRISLAELKFLRAYLGFMQGSLFSGNANLDKSLSEVKKLLDGAISRVKDTIKNEEAKLQETTLEINALSREENTRTNQITELNNLPNRTIEQDQELTLKRREQTRLVSARENRTALQAEIAVLKNSPALINTQQLEEAYRQADEVATEAETALNNARTDPAITNDALQALELALNAANHQADTELNALDAEQDRNVALQTAGANLIKTNTEHLNNCTQALRAVRLGLGSMAEVNEPEGITNAAERKLQQRFDEIFQISINCKKPDKYCMKVALEIRDELGKLNANPNHEIRLTQETRNYIRDNPASYKSMGFVFEHAGNNVSTYAHACEILDTPERRSENTTYAPDLKEKKLALQMIGAWCAQQTARNSDNFSKIGLKTSTVLDAAADMLTAKIVAKTPRAPTATEISDRKGKMLEAAASSHLATVKAELQALPENTTLETYKNAYLNAMALNSVESLVAHQYSASQLVKMAEGDKTFKNDRHAEINMFNDGKSRQSIFREAMIRASGLIKPPAMDEQELTGANRIAPVAGALHRDANEEALLKSRLGLEQPNQNGPVSDELLDQLVMAATAHNDLSLSADHKHRGSMLNKIERYDENPTFETVFKNHNLNGYSTLSNILTNTAINIRSDVDAAIQRTEHELENNPERMNVEKVQRLVKQIIITTDAKSSQSEQFNLKKLVESSENLVSNNTPANRAAFKEALVSTRAAWTSTNGNQAAPTKQDWNTKDSRSLANSILSGNPIRSAPFVNRIPGLSHITSASYKIAKIGILAAAGLTAGAVGSALVIAACPLAAAIVVSHKGYKSIKR